MQNGQRCFRGFVENFQQRFCGAGGATLALLPITNRVQRDIDFAGELGLTEAQTPANTSGKFCCIQRSIGLI